MSGDYVENLLQKYYLSSTKYSTYTIRFDDSTIFALEPPRNDDEEVGILNYYNYPLGYNRVNCFVYSKYALALYRDV